MRGPADLKNTAVFIGGTDVAEGEKFLSAARKCFFGPMRVSLMLDSNGANTTAAAAVLSAKKHVALKNATVTVLGTRVRLGAALSDSSPAKAPTSLSPRVRKHVLKKCATTFAKPSQTPN